MLGLTRYQSKALVIIMAKESVPASAISKLTEIPITKIYQVLKSLEDKELVSIVPGKPKIYKSFTPTKVFNKLLAKKQKVLEILEQRKKMEITEIKQLTLPNLVEEKFAKVHPILSAEKYLNN